VRAKSMLAFALAIGCGLVAMIGVQQSLKKNNVDPDADKITLYVAATEIPPGQVLDIAMLEKKKFLKTSVPKEAVTDPAQLERRALIVKVMPGDIIRMDKLGEEGKTGASISIPVGMRVVTVPANMTFAHSGMLKPEDRVDIMVTYKVKEGRQEYSETKTFLSYVEVFATDSVRDPNAGSDPSGKASILKNLSLLVTPDQAQTIAMAKSIGELTMNLRNTSDKQQIEVNNLTPDQFRTNILQASIPPDDEHGRSSAPIGPGGENSNAVLAFAENMMGNQDATQGANTGKKNAPEAATEAWDITIFNKNETKIETVEVERRKGVVKPTQMIATESKAKKVLNSILDAFENPTTEAVALKPVRVGRPIYADGTGKPTLGNLQARLPNSMLPEKSVSIGTGSNPPEVTVKPEPVKGEKSLPVSAPPVPDKSTKTKPAASKAATTNPAK
jgi:pilus assembly protein CpaB